MGGILGSSSNQNSTTVSSSSDTELTKQLKSWLSNQLSSLSGYSGQLTADETAQEKQSTSLLQKYLDSTDSSLTTAAKKEYSDTLSSDKYDPATSGYYQAVKAEANKNLAETQKNIASQAAGGGSYWSGARLASQSDAAEDTANSLNETIYSLANQERQNKLTAASAAADLGQEETETDLKKAAAAQTYGSLERTLQQSSLDKLYSDYLNTQSYGTSLANIIASLAGAGSTSTSAKTYDSSDDDETGQYIALAASLATLLL